MTEGTAQPLLEARRITKTFPGVRALEDVDLVLNRGEVLAVLGENGAGKSTLMKILAGVQPATSGDVRLHGEPVEFSGVHDAIDRGIALIHQELNLATNLSVGANLFLGREPHRRGFLDEGRIRRHAAGLLARVGLDCPAEALVEDLPIGRQQLVEIAKALSTEARILIMDEPTSSLTLQETERLFQVIRDLRAHGVSVIYISHRLGEIREVADRVAVLRDGRNAGELGREEIHHDAMVRLMVGRELHVGEARAAAGSPEPLLEVRKLRTPAYPEHELSFRLGGGEIVGIAGLIGAGRSELLHTLFGITPPLAGTVHLRGNPLPLSDPRAPIAGGLALVPEDRKKQGLILDMSVRENITLTCLPREKRHGLFLNPPREEGISHEMIDQLGIKTPHDRQTVRFLSGGNQQKVVLAKWLALRPAILLLDEPTRGVDIGAKQEIYETVEHLAERGLAVLFVSSEMEEVLRLAQRTLVMHEGAIAGSLDREQMTEEAIMQLATGQAVVKREPGNVNPKH